MKLNIIQQDSFFKNSNFLNSSEQLLNLYVSYREAGINFINKLSPLLSKNVLLSCGKKLGLVRGKNLIINNENDIEILFDYCLFYHYVNDKNLIERFTINKMSELNNNEKTVALAMIKADFALLGIVKNLEHGGVVVKDLLRDNDQVLLLDKGLSLNAKPGLILMSTIIRYPEFIMTTGVPLPINNLTDELNFLLTELSYEYDNFDIMPKLSKAKFIASLLKLSLYNGASELVEYQDI